MKWSTPRISLLRGLVVDLHCYTIVLQSCSFCWALSSKAILTQKQNSTCLKHPEGIVRSVKSMFVRIENPSFTLPIYIYIYLVKSVCCEETSWCTFRTQAAGNGRLAAGPDLHHRACLKAQAHSILKYMSQQRSNDQEWNG